MSNRFSLLSSYVFLFAVFFTTNSCKKDSPVSSPVQKGIISTVAGNGTSGNTGDGGLAINAELYFPKSIAYDILGNVYYCDSKSTIRKISITHSFGIGGPQNYTGATISTIAGTAGDFSYNGDGGQASLSKLYGPSGIKVDASGNIYIADQGNRRIRKIDGSGIISTVAGNGTATYGGDGGLAINASINPYNLCIDSKGQIFIADWTNHRIRKVDVNGVITTIAGNGTQGFSGDGGLATLAQLNYPEDIAVDGSGNIYIVDSYNARIRMINASGIISTIAGGGSKNPFTQNVPADSVNINCPSSIALDVSGNIYFNNGCLVSVVGTNGIIKTVVGSPTPSCNFGGDGGSALGNSVSLNIGCFGAIAVDKAGSIYIADWGNHRIRVVD